MDLETPFKALLRIAAACPGGRLIEGLGSAHDADDQPPLRAELFSADQMEQHGRALASAHVLRRSTSRNQLLKRLAENEQVLIDTRSLLAVAVKSKLQITPAGEWLLDNFYLIEEQIRAARKHLPTGYSRELPQLARGPSAGLPRVYDMALETISHGDGRVDSSTLHRFVAAYQTVTPLRLGELWAIPIMLRLALIENLRRVGARITAARIHLNQAQNWADQMMETAEKDPKSLILVIADMARSDPPMASAFVAELARRLQGHGPALAWPLTWIEQRLAESSLTIEQLVLSENQQQAADQVSISNTIGSLRFLGAMDWREFVETMSVVEQILLQDCNDVYRRMDFATRDRYRRVVDRLAKHSRMPEPDVARRAVEMAKRTAARVGDGDPESHVGFYLIDRGLPELESAVEVRLAALERIRRSLGRSPLRLHVGAILFITAVFTEALVLRAYDDGLVGWRLVPLGLLSVVGASQLASALVNWLATLLATPQLLPRMDFAGGLPPELRTLVVIPSMLHSAQNIDELLEGLEVRFLGNQDDHLHFGLLTDFRDAQEQTLAEDEPLLQRACNGIEKLNRKYRSAGSDRFHLFHRSRSWNSLERIWMGYERKRGKLADLNAWLRGAGPDRFSALVGSFETGSRVKYVITLDTDTQLPRDSARQFVAAMAHPLNRPRYDGDRHLVCAGYGILQPGMAASQSGSSRSRYSQLCGSEPGFDPYTRSVSDVYQDLFGEGSFIGKGIYDVDAFEYALKERFPENRILSHDLLEGCYARSGLMSDAHLFEEYPPQYLADVSRHRRWIRGDWQIAHWVLPRVPGPDRRKLRNPLSRLSRWKILDNLRRNLVSAALVSLLLLGWFALPHPWLWTLTVAGVLLIPPGLVCLVDALRRPGGVLLIQHLAAVLRSAGRNFATAGFRLACLPFDAQFSLGAMLRTAWRMGVTHRHLLEWSVAGEQDRGRDSSIAACYRSMWIAPATAAATAAALGWARPEAVLAAGPILALWLAAPRLAWWLSLPLVHHQAKVSAQQEIFLRKIARKTWAFFDHFVVADDHWLPPDNFQEGPGPEIAHRTSPTNIGLALLANLSAFDFGFIPAGSLIQRTRGAFDAIALLERYLGHFYNWYDTQSLLPLRPRYISSVDSGNLAGFLLTLRSGLLALPDQKVVGPRLFEGLVDTLGALADATAGSGQAPIARLHALLEAARALHPSTLPATFECLKRISTYADEVQAGVDATHGEEAHEWAGALSRQCKDALEELRFLAPWLTLPAAPGDLGSLADFGDFPTLRDLARGTAASLLLVDARLQESGTPEQQAWLTELRRQVAVGGERAKERIATGERLADQATVRVDGVRLPVRQVASPAGDRLQRR